MQFGLKKRNNFDTEIDTFRRSISNLFDDFFALKPSSMFDSEWVPSIDVHEDSKGIYVKAEIPGIEEKNLDVNLENNILTIKGEKNEERREDNDKKTIIMERKYGSFQRSIRLPEGIKADKIKAEFKNGVLNIDIPKDKVEETKKIKINVK
jgi:HSP20 family protein